MLSIAKNNFPSIAQNENQTDLGLETYLYDEKFISRNVHVPKSQSPSRPEFRVVVFSHIP